MSVMISGSVGSSDWALARASPVSAPQGHNILGFRHGLAFWHSCTASGNCSCPMVNVVHALPANSCSACTMYEPSSGLGQPLPQSPQRHRSAPAQLDYVVPFVNHLYGYRVVGDGIANVAKEPDGLVIAIQVHVGLHPKVPYALGTGVLVWPRSRQRHGQHEKESKGCQHARTA